MTHRDYIRLLSFVGPQEAPRIAAAWQYGRRHLSVIRRSCGERYDQHSLRVACTLGEMTLKSSMISTALLHDLDLCAKAESLTAHAPLTPAEKKLTRTMHIIGRHSLYTKEGIQAMASVIQEDPNVLPLCLAHCVADVRRLQNFSPAVRKKMAYDSLFIYAPLAGKLGMYSWRSDLEDYSFPIVHPGAANRLQRKLAALHSDDNESIERMQELLAEKLTLWGIGHELSARIKTPYSLYKKMLANNLPFERVHDRLAVRIVVQSIPDCYKALGVVHTLFPPVSGYFKDYIGRPKENGYHSLHTVIQPSHHIAAAPIEVQIRTQEMHQKNQYGSSAHGSYKNPYVFSPPNNLLASLLKL